jgi:hypothetical protein
MDVTDIICPKCLNGDNCSYKFPIIEDFKEGGRFSHIKLPIGEDQELPDEIIEYVFGTYHFYQCKPRHVYNIRQSLNKLLIP